MGLRTGIICLDDSEKLLRFRAACLPEQQVRGHMIFLALMNPGVSAECWLKMVHSVLGMRFSGVRERQNWNGVFQFQFSHSVVSDSLRPHELQPTRPPCPSPTPGVYTNSRPLSQRCHPTISSSVIPFSSCLQSFPATGSFPMSQLFASGGQGIRVSASTSVLPMNIQGWLPLGWTGWISLQSKGL